MAFLQFPKNTWIKTIDTSEVVTVGGFKPTNNGELNHIRLRMFKHGALPGATKGKCRIHQVTDTSAVFAESNQVLFTAVETALSTTGDWISWVRFDFSRPNFSKNITYTVSFAFDTYTRVADTFYMGISYDFQFPTYDPASSVDAFTKSTLSLQVFSFQEPPVL